MRYTPIISPQFKLFMAPKKAPTLTWTTPWLKPGASQEDVVDYLSTIVRRDNMTATCDYDFSVVSRRFFFKTKALVCTFPPEPTPFRGPLPYPHEYDLSTEMLERGLVVEREVKKARLTDAQVVSGEFFVCITLAEGGNELGGWYSWERHWGWVRCACPVVEAYRGQIEWTSFSGTPHVLRLGEHRATYLHPADEAFIDTLPGAAAKLEEAGDWHYFKGWTKTRPWFWKELWRDDRWYRMQEELAAIRARHAAECAQDEEEARLVSSPTVAGLEKELDPAFEHTATSAPAITKSEVKKAPKVSVKAAPVIAPANITEITEAVLMEGPDIDF
jgi:hypothetical protein